MCASAAMLGWWQEGDHPRRPPTAPSGQAAGRRTPGLDAHPAGHQGMHPPRRLSSSPATGHAPDSWPTVRRPADTPSSWSLPQRLPQAPRTWRAAAADTRTAPRSLRTPQTSGRRLRQSTARRRVPPLAAAADTGRPSGCRPAASRPTRVGLSEAGLPVGRLTSYRLLHKGQCLCLDAAGGAGIELCPAPLFCLGEPPGRQGS